MSTWWLRVKGTLVKEIDFELPGSSRPRWPRHLIVASLGVFVVVMLMGAGARLHSYMTPKPLPSNQQCLQANQAVKEAAKSFSVQLVAALDGQDAPAVDLSAVKNASVDCRANVSVYKVAQP